MRFHFSCTRNPHTEREVYTMRTPRLRLLSAILAVALFFTLLPVSALAEGGVSTGVSHVATRSLNTDNKDDQGLTYTLNAADHTATVANYDNHTLDGVINIPDTVISGGQTYTVTAINNAAFPNSAVTSVTIPDSVTAIHDVSFFNCSQLTNISIPNSVTYIGDSAFSYCTSLKSITLPSSLSTISRALFFRLLSVDHDSHSRFCFFDSILCFSRLRKSQNHPHSGLCHFHWKLCF